MMAEKVAQLAYSILREKKVYKMDYEVGEITVNICNVASPGSGNKAAIHISIKNADPGVIFHFYALMFS